MSVTKQLSQIAANEDQAFFGTPRRRLFRGGAVDPEWLQVAVAIITNRMSHVASYVYQLETYA